MSLSLEQASSGSFCLTKVGLAIGSTATQLSTAAAATTTVDGIFQASKGATASFAIAAPSGFTVATVPIGYKASHAVWLDAAGTLTVTQGPLDVISAATDKVGPPVNPGSRACIAVFTVAAVTAAWIPATTAMNAAGVTTTYTDVINLPGGAIA